MFRVSYVNLYINIFKFISRLIKKVKEHVRLLANFTSWFWKIQKSIRMTVRTTSNPTIQK